MNRRGTVTPFFLVGLCALLVGSLSAAVIHVDNMATGIWTDTNVQMNILRIELEATRMELQHVRETYSPVMDILSSEDIELIKKIDQFVSEGRDTSNVRTAIAAVVASRLHKVPLETILGVITVESHFNPDAVSSANAKGLMQLTGLIWRHYSQDFIAEKDVYDPLHNVLAGTEFLADLRAQYGEEKALFACTKTLLHYWGGPKAVEAGSGNYAKLVITQAKRWHDVLSKS